MDLIIWFVIFAIIWVIALYRMCKGLRTGVITHRFAVGESELETFTCRRADKPKLFWSLVCFYLLIVIVVPLFFGYCVVVRIAE